MGCQMSNIIRSKTPLMVTQYAIRSYASATDNCHPIYNDPTAVVEWGVKKMMAPSCFFGQLALSKVMLGQDEYIPTGGIHINQKYKFLHPVYEGDSISIELSVGRYIDERNRNILEYKLDFYNQHDEKVCQSIMTNIINKT